MSPFSDVVASMTRKTHVIYSAYSRGSTNDAGDAPPALSSPGLESIEELGAAARGEVLKFLAERPVHTVIMSGLIHDNGLENPLSRGTFYGYRGQQGVLEGVALIGHATLVEARTEIALAALARLAGSMPGVNLILGEQEKIETFWNYYSEANGAAHYRRRELLFEQRWPLSGPSIVPALRLATLDDLNLVVTAHARMAEEELGMNLLATDPEGFRLRCARRVQQRRVWVWIRQGRLIFKADVVAYTREASYIEGVYVDPAERGKGYGARCLSHVSRKLLERTRALCLLVSEDNRVAQGVSRKAGYTVTSCYETIFMRSRPANPACQEPTSGIRCQEMPA
jgi:ribosomal protein S18 acetylase RimI-like enzyme